MLEKTLESPLDFKEIQPVHPKVNQLWVFTGRTDVVAETPILWSPDGKSWLIWKDPHAGKDWGQEENGTTEDEMIGLHPNSMDMGLGGLRDLVMDREAWRAAIHGFAKSRTRLSDWTELMPNWASLVARMVKNVLQCRRPRFGPWVGKVPWRREWLPTPVFLPGESHE